MNVQDAMTNKVVSVKPETTVGEIAALLVNHRISAVPVVSEDNRIIGIVSQTDRGHRSETGTERKRKWWLAIFDDAEVQAREYLKSHGLRAGDVMTRHVITVTPTMGLSEVAETLDTHHIRQVPVVDDGKLVGMISRADLVRKLAEASITASAARPQNGQLQKAVWAAIKSQPWLNSAILSTSVLDGAVEIYGAVNSDAERQALRVLIENVPGVRRVENRVGILPRSAA
ncbi:CBS domain-containing protein [Hyphomicrobium sp. CS1BSMeth3]|uniref:CBS domain-containing protein n=1 Tax=Hyphomicrobium sp. CS1BSMeth3 TaxID=1892844 RepID=UPI000931B6A4|nr:CBS domain-containing protein [Hyphomicrobium sp. CS1BSMeth3]